MGYNKFIVSGDYVEIYQYEKDIPPYRNIQKRARRAPENQVLGAPRQDTLSERQLGKRRDHANRARLDFARRVRANLGGVDTPLLLTLTYRENFTDLRAANRDLTAFFQALRYHEGPGFKYICVPEFQKRGAVHYHALVWGLSESVVSQERRTRFISTLWGQGFVFLKKTDGHEKLSYYLAKYMAKAYTDVRLGGLKAYTASRNFAHPAIYAGIGSVGLVEDALELSTLQPLKEKQYMTKWLGKGRYRLYKYDSIKQ